MKIKAIKVFCVLSLTSAMACSQNNEAPKNEAAEVSDSKIEMAEYVPHNYGGWYCPDNLFGFPPVDIAEWNKVPVINGRMPTQEEARSGASLIYVDPEEHPNAKVLPIEMPKLAHFNNSNTDREELIIVIQAFVIGNDTIVGFRYLNGGNGSSRLNEIQILSDAEIEKIPNTRFFSKTIEIDAPKTAVWKVLTDTENAVLLQPSLGMGLSLTAAWRQNLNVNYYYPNAGPVTASYAGELYGNNYIQNDYERLNFTEKFLVVHNSETNRTELVIECGPFGDDFKAQQRNLNNWAQKVKELSEKD